MQLICGRKRVVSASDPRMLNPTAIRILWWGGAVFALVLAIGMPKSASADPEADVSWATSFMAGYGFIDADSELTHSEPFTGSLNNAPLASIRLRYQFHRMFSAEASVLYGRTKTKRDNNNPDKLVTELFSPRIDVMIHPFRWGRVTPYLAIGGGVIFVDRDERLTELRSASKDLGYGGNVGIGAEYKILQGVAIRLDGRVFGYEAGVFALNYELLAGISVGWGDTTNDRDGDGIPDALDGAPDKPEDKDGFRDDDGVPDLDNDNDKILDVNDKCPLDPETYNDFEDSDGCPDGKPDADKDGISDDQDKCRTEPEDIDNFQDEDGCPDLDNDKDGIADADDKCPNQPETKNGLDDEDGCPDVHTDTDGDGVFDGKDKCPSEKETYNGFEDSDGCPDKLPKKVKKFTGSIVGVTFISGRSKLTVNAKRVLRRAVVVLKEYDKLRIRIEGHTDSRGSDKSNLRLSQERAESVMLFLVENGISRSRLTAVGFGEARPIASNRNRRGRTLNRRVEFHLITSRDAQGASEEAE